jgi:hypothetical protein
MGVQAYRFGGRPNPGWLANSYPIPSAPTFLFADACNRSLGAALAHLERSTHLRPRKPIPPQGSHSHSIHLDAGPSELLPFRASIAQPSLDPFLNECTEGKPVNLDALATDVIRPALDKQRLQWHGWHAFRRGLATNLHRLAVQDEIIQRILRHSNIGVTQK